MSATHVDVSVLVPVLNEERHIRDTVAAMRAQRFDGDLEFLFADGSSEDRTKGILLELASDDPRIRVFDNPRRRTPSGLNVCLRNAHGTYVARMDAHTFYPPDYLAAGVERLGHGDTEWVSGPAIPEPVGRVSRAVARALGTFMGQGGSRKWESISADPDGGEAQPPAEIELDSGVFAGVWRREKVLALGGWDEGWPSNQDAEMAGRFIAAGERLICLPRMGARYVPRDTLRGVYHQYWGYGHYRVRTWRRHPVAMRRAQVLTPAIVAAAVSALVAPRPLRRVARAGMGAYGAALGLETVRALRRGVPPGDAVLVPAALVAMHFGYGVGVWRGVFRFGPPLAALAHIAGLPALSAGLAGAPEPVEAPSLHEAA